MCGEHTIMANIIPYREESSPHVRGTPDHRLTGREHCWNHPRMCGEHSFLATLHLQSSESSPHVRGTHSSSVFMFFNSGIIPACAGNTLWFPNRGRSTRNHPRMCGEHTKKIAQYQGRFFPHEYFSFTFTLRISSLSGICSHCSTRVEEYQRKILPSSLWAALPVPTRRNPSESNPLCAL